MDIMRLSDQYTVEVLSDRDIPAVLKLSESNPQYFHYFPPAASTESIKADMQELPEGKSREDKYYLGFREKSEKNEFKPTGTIKKIAGIDVVVAQRRIGSTRE